MSLTCGVGSKFPCPVCLVPDASLANIKEVYAPHTAEETQAIIKQAANMNITNSEALLKSYGLRPVQVSSKF
jgi:hypothetical protein